MNVFIRAMVRIFSFGERWNGPFNWTLASLNGTFHLSPHENILTIARIETFIICITIQKDIINCDHSWNFPYRSIVSFKRFGRNVGRN